MKEAQKRDILKIVVYYAIFTAIVLLSIFIFFKIKKSDYVFDDYPIRVEELRRFEYDGDTVIVLKIEYDKKDYITTKIKSKK